MSAKPKNSKKLAALRRRDTALVDANIILRRALMAAIEIDKAKGYY